MSNFTGATVVGVKVRDGVVLATDTRMSYGGFIVSRSFKKVFLIMDKVGIAFAGLYGDVGGLVRFLEAQVKLYSLESGRKPSIASIAKYLSTLLYSYKYFPFFVEVLVGGIDSSGKPAIYVLDPLGSIISEDYAAAGSGATVAYGTLESGYNPEMSLDEAVELAINAVKAAILRDAGTGDGIDVLSIPVNGEASLNSIRLTLSEERRTQ